MIGAILLVSPMPSADAYYPPHTLQSSVEFGG